MTRFNYNVQDDPQLALAIDKWLPTRRRGRASSVPAGTTFTVSNFPAFAWADIISAGAGEAATNGDVAGGSFVTGTCGATSGDRCGFLTATAATRRSWNPHFSFYFATAASIASIRLWIGMFTSDPSDLSTLATLSGAAFGFDTGLDSGVWRCESANASTAQTNASPVAVVASHSYTGRIVVNDALGRVDFYLADNGLLSAGRLDTPLKLVASHSTSVPVAATPLIVGGTVRTSAAATKSMGMGRIEFNQD